MVCLSFVALSCAFVCWLRHDLEDVNKRNQHRAATTTTTSGLAAARAPAAGAEIFLQRRSVQKMEEDLLRQTDQGEEKNCASESTF